MHSQALTALGVDVVKADLEDVESLKKAFQGAYGVFGVTNCTYHLINDVWASYWALMYFLSFFVFSLGSLFRRERDATWKEHRRCRRGDRSETPCLVNP